VEVIPVKMTAEQAAEWTAYLDGPADATPPAWSLLDHWRAATEKGQTLAWGEDRAQAILAHIDALAAELAAEREHVERLRETLTFNRKQAERVEKRHLQEMANLREVLALLSAR
jgi:hypothetical protein